MKKNSFQKSVYLIGLLTVIFVSQFYTPAFSQVRELTPELSVLIEEALQNNPQIKAGRERVQAARYRLPQASALPDPSVRYAYMGEMLETRFGPQENNYEFEQEIPFPGKLMQKRKMARAGVELAEAELTAMERDISAKVAQTYYDLFVLDKMLTLSEQMQALSGKSESILQANYAGMRGSQTDVVKIQSEVTRSLEKLIMLRQQKESLSAYLTALLNRPDVLSVDFPNEPVLPGDEISLDRLIAGLDQHNPQILQALAMTKREQHAYSLAKYENAPDFSIGFQYVEIGDGTTTHPEDGRDAWMIPFKVTLPIWQNRIGPAIKEARSNLSVSESNLQETKNLALFEIKHIYFQYQSRKTIVDLYRNEYLPQSKLRLQSRQSAYESGTVEITEVIESERMLLETQMAYYEALSNALKSYSEMERLIGPEIIQEVNHD
ncbi:MAG: TolC family protein [Candidatus Omnitrophota bacterium]